jgi:hypothetical protein
MSLQTKPNFFLAFVLLQNLHIDSNNLIIEVVILVYFACVFF